MKGLLRQPFSCTGYSSVVSRDGGVPSGMSTDIRVRLGNRVRTLRRQRGWMVAAPVAASLPILVVFSRCPRAYSLAD